MTEPKHTRLTCEIADLIARERRLAVYGALDEAVERLRQQYCDEPTMAGARAAALAMQTVELLRDGYRDAE